MIKRVLIKDLKDHIDKEVTVAGFAHAIRIQSKVIFLLVRDITGIIQTVFVGPEDIDREDFENNLHLESVVYVTGNVVLSKQAPSGFEIQIKKGGLKKELPGAKPELPIPVVVKGNDEETEAPTRFDYRWLDLRKPEKTKIFRIWTEFEKGWRKYWDKEGYMQIYTPSFMSTPSESGAEVFEVKYFDRKAYLAQSPQFYKQMAMASGFEKVFIVGPVFRAEESFTTRHMTEFTGWDFEIAYVESHKDIMKELEGMIIAGFKQIQEYSLSEDYQSWPYGLPGYKIPEPNFPELTMIEAKEILAKRGIPSAEEHDLSPEEEREISAYILEEKNHEFVFITEYHKSKSAFYHMRTEEDSDRSRRADLLYRGIEVTTLAQREHRPEILERQAREKNMDLEPLKDYINFFRYGCPPHGGAGIGPARFIMKILDLSNVREATYLPRDVKRLNP